MLHDALRRRTLLLLILNQELYCFSFSKHIREYALHTALKRRTLLLLILNQEPYCFIFAKHILEYSLHSALKRRILLLLIFEPRTLLLLILKAYPRVCAPLCVEEKNSIASHLEPTTPTSKYHSHSSKPPICRSLSRKYPFSLLFSVFPPLSPFLENP